MKRLAKYSLPLALIALSSGIVHSEELPKVKIAWSIYVGSMPLGYAQDTGILKKWGKKYGVDLEAVQVNDYVEGINQYTTGQFDGVITMVLDALTIPAASGVDTSMPILLSNSLGNDGLIMKGDTDLKSLKGKQINLVQFSGSHYLMTRALDSVGLTEKDIKIVNTSDADMTAMFPDSSIQGMVTWKPQLSNILEQNKDAHLVFSSADIPGEINDGIIIHTELLKKNPGIGKAITGAWYEVMQILATPGAERDKAVAAMADASGSSVESFENQLKTTHFYKPKEAADYVASKQFHDGFTKIQQFSFKHGLLGDGAKSADFVGVDFQGSITGNSQNVRLHFPVEYMSQQ